MLKGRLNASVQPYMNTTPEGMLFVVVSDNHGARLKGLHLSSKKNTG